LRRRSLRANLKKRKKKWTRSENAEIERKRAATRARNGTTVGRPEEPRSKYYLWRLGFGVGEKR
jgi:hypothetical protein